MFGLRMGGSASAEFFDHTVDAGVKLTADRKMKLIPFFLS